MVSTDRTTTRISITLPAELLAHYEAQAKQRGVSLDAILEERMQGCRNHNDGRALYFTDMDRQMLERLLDSSVGTPSDALKRIQHALQITVDGAPIELSPKLLERLKARAIRVDFKKMLQETVLKQLEHHVGLR